MKEILFSSDHLEDRVALLEDGELAEIFIARGERMVGSIYKGKVINVLPGMQAAFVDVGLERNTFLCLDDALPSYLHDEIEEDSKRGKNRTTSIEQIFKPKQEALVQVVKEPLGAKGARITTNIAIPGRYLVLLPLGNYVGVSRKVETAEERDRLKVVAEKIKPENMGLIIRTAAESKDEKTLQRDLNFLTKLWESVRVKSETARAPILLHQELGLIERVMRDMFTEDVKKFLVDSRPIFEKVLEFAHVVSPQLANRVYYYEGIKPLFELYQIENEIGKLLHKKVWLPSGGYVIIEPTEALTVIDVNTGKYVGNRSLDETILRTNLEAAHEIARQIRLRDLSGIIIIDFIDMERKEDKKKLLSALEGHLKSDRVRTTIFGITDLGLVEITRKRSGKNLDRLLREECFYCGGHGRLESPETVAIQLERQIRREVGGDNPGGLLVTTHPQVAIELAGWEGSRIRELEESIGREIFLRVNPNFHLEKYRLDWKEPKEILQQLKLLKEGEMFTIDLQVIHPQNFQSVLDFIEGQIVEIANAANRVGEQVSVRIRSASRYYNIAEIISNNGTQQTAK